MLKDAVKRLGNARRKRKAYGIEAKRLSFGGGRFYFATDVAWVMRLNLFGAVII